MDGFFRRLQEVADLPNQRRSDDADAAGADGDDDDGKLSREDLLEELQLARQRAAAAEEMSAALRKEASDINDQFSAFKTKVNTWREQIKQSRAQDRRTIEVLREAAGAVAAGTAGGADGAAGAAAAAAAVDSTYLASLEEQVTALKEAVRRHAAERDEVQLELDRVRARAKKDLLEATAAANTPPPASVPAPSSAPSDGTSTGAADADAIVQAAVAAAVRKYQVLVQRLEEDAAAVQLKIDSLEKANEVLSQELDQANSALTSAAAQHAKTLKDAKAEAQRTTSAQYVKDLEAELQQYRRQLKDAQEELADSHAALDELRRRASSANNQAGADARAEVSPTNAAEPADGQIAPCATNGNDAAGSRQPSLPHAGSLDDTAAIVRVPASTTSSAAAQRRLQSRIEDLEREAATSDRRIRVLESELERSKSALAELEAEGELREATLNTVFAENTVLRERIDVLRAKLHDEAATMGNAERQLQEREAAVADATVRAEGLAKALEAAQRQITKLQRDHAEKADALRQMKLVELQRETEAKVRQQQQQQQQRGGAAAGSSSSGVPAASHTAGADSSSGPPPHDVLLARLQALSLQAKYERYLAAGKQMWSNARLRSYAVAAGVLMLLVLFMFYQGTAIEQDAATVDLLRRCRELAKGASAGASGSIGRSTGGS